MNQVSFMKGRELWQREDIKNIKQLRVTFE